MALNAQPVLTAHSIRESESARGRGEGALALYGDWLALLVIALGFCCRAWMAHAAFFNTDEAWHFSIANQDSLLQAYRASLTIWHPPLLVLLLYFSKSLGTSNLMLRLPGIVAGTVFCWLYYKWSKIVFGRSVAWTGLLLVTFLPTMVRMSAELRQYPFLLMFSAAAAYFLERALAADSARMMLLSSACLWLAMLSHYSAFLFAASIGAYAIYRMLRQKVSRQVITAWCVGQVGGVALAGFFYVTQIRKLRAMYAGAHPLQRLADWYLPQFYYHPAHDHLALFLVRGTFGIFRFIFAWVILGHVATLLFFAGIILLLLRKFRYEGALFSGSAAMLLLVPFLVSWIAVAAGLYPFGRTRHTIFLAMFAIAGVSVTLVQMARRKIAVALALAAVIVLLSGIFGTLPGHDMLPLADSRYENMNHAMEFLERQVSPTDVIYVNKSTDLQVAHYLCDQKTVIPDRSVAGFESFRCHGLRVISSFPTDDAVAIETFPAKWREMARAYNLKAGSKVWVVEGGWSRGFAEQLQARYPEFAGVDARSFGNYLQMFHLTVGEIGGATGQT
jgi:hypothetical protein